MSWRGRINAGWVQGVLSCAAGCDCYTLAAGFHCEQAGLLAAHLSQMREAICQLPLEVSCSRLSQGAAPRRVPALPVQHLPVIKAAAPAKSWAAARALCVHVCPRDGTRLLGGRHCGLPRQLGPNIALEGFGEPPLAITHVQKLPQLVHPALVLRAAILWPCGRFAVRGAAGPSL